MNRVLMILIGLGLITVPAAVSFAESEWTVEMAAPRVGDVYAYESTWSNSVTDANGTIPTEGRGLTTIRIEDSATIPDAWGVPREADTFRIVTDADYVDDITCHQRRGTREGIRRDLNVDRAGEEGEGGALSGAGVPFITQWTWKRNVTVTFDPEPCSPMLSSTRHVYGAGVARFGDFLSAGPFDEVEGHVTRTSFAGVNAATATFDVRALFDPDPENVPEGVSGTLAITVADGYPGIVRVTLMLIAATEELTRDSTYTLTLRGFERGGGDELARAIDLMPLGPDPRDMVAYDPLSLDVSAFGVAYPFADAFVAERDSRGDDRMANFVADHPDARLAYAAYDRTYEGMKWRGALPTEGGWMILLASPSEGSHEGLLAARWKPPAELADPLGEYQRQFQESGLAIGMTESYDFGDAAPDSVITMDAAARIGAAHGMPPEKVVSIVHLLRLDVRVDDAGEFQRIASPAVRLSDAPFLAEGEHEGTTLTIDRRGKGLVEIAIERVRGQSSRLLLDDMPEPAPVPTGQARAASITIGPVSDLQVAEVALITSVLAGIVILLKYGAFPLFTRLVRERLLEHPVRADLYRVIRAEPGIRQNELVELAGVGEGATRRHLDALVRHRFVVDVREGVAKGYFAAGEVPRDVAERSLLLRPETTRRVYDLYVASPSMTLREAGVRLGLSAPAIHRAKKRLEAEGLLPANAAEVRASTIR